MNCRSGFFIIFSSLVVIVITACTAPLGYLNNPNNRNNPSLNSLMLITNPHRTSYNVGDLFSRESDLKVYVSHDGLMENVSMSSVDIAIIEAPDDFSPKPPVPVSADPDSEWYTFKKAGRKEIVVNYNGLSDKYSIEVQDLLGITDPDTDPDSGGGIVIIWQ